MENNPLIRLRERSGLSPSELAAKAGTNRQMIYKLERQRSISAKWAERLAPHLGVSPSDLLFPNADQPAPLANFDQMTREALEFELAHKLRLLGISSGDVPNVIRELREIVPFWPK